MENFYGQARKIFFEEKRIFFPYIFAFMGFFLMVFLVWSQMPRMSSGGYETFPLHYNIHFGVDFLGQWFAAFAPPLVGILFMIINSVLIWWFWMRLRVLSVITLTATIVIQGTLLGVAALLVALNT